MSSRSKNRCLSKDELTAFILGKLTRKSDSRVLDHLDTCSTCSQVVQGLEESADGALRELQTPDIPDPYLEEPELQTALRQVTTPSVTGIQGSSAKSERLKSPEKAIRPAQPGRPQQETPREQNEPPRRTKEPVRQSRTEPRRPQLAEVTDRTRTPESGRSNIIRNIAIGVGGIAVVAFGAMLTDFGAKRDQPATGTTPPAASETNAASAASQTSPTGDSGIATTSTAAARRTVSDRHHWLPTT